MIHLTNSLLSLEIEPKTGASVTAFRYKNSDILYPASDTNNPRDCSLFLMLPYCSQITDGIFTYFGITRHVLKNDALSPHPIHGDGWKNVWTVEQLSENQATLVYLHDKTAGGFPFDYKATAVYTLIDNRLQITLSLANPAKLPMPCGMGIYPYFLNKSQAKLTFSTTHVWWHYNDPIFDRPYETPKEWNFSNGKQLTENFDTSFGGWDGQAIIEYPNHLNIHIHAQPLFRHVTLHTPQDKLDCFCFAPTSNTPDAFNLAALGVINTGIQSIGPNQTLTQTIVFEISESL